MQDQSNRNTLIFIVAAAILLFGYQFLVLAPAAKQRQAEAAANAPAAAAASVDRQAPRIAVPAAITREAALAASPRAPIATPALAGSVSLEGARIDDLRLTQYREKLPKDSPPVDLLRPEGTKDAYFTEFGWTGQNVPGLPGPDTRWTLTSGATLAPGQPLVMTTANGAGLVFTRRIEVDDKYMFTVTDTVANLGTMPVTLAPYGSVQRQGLPDDLGKNSIVHEGAIGLVDGKTPKLKKYKDWLKKGGGEEMPSTGGWFGITDKYWMAALVPNQAEKVRAQYRVTKAPGVDIYETSVVGPTRTIQPGRQVSETMRLFAGAKTVPVLQGYQEALGIANFKNAVDWGMFWFLTQPLFAFLEWIFSHVGNFGIAIMILTVCVRLLFFPLAQKQYESLTKMKKLQPQMEELKVRYKDDPPRQQQEVMALYQREGANPLAGCVPILFQIPVFYALYKVLTVTIEMRHAPFAGWIKDLSEKDPTTVWNLFGAIPWDPISAPLVGGLLAGPLHLGVLPLAYGVTMWLTTSMSPPAPDPMQQRIMQLMPIMFTFIMAPFAVGLLIYWTWSNVLTIFQQYVIMRRFKVDNPIDQIIRRLTGKPKPTDVG